MTPSISMTTQLAEALEILLNYLVGQSKNAVLDKRLLRRLEELVNLLYQD